MKDLMIVLGTIVAVIVIGALLFFYGPQSFRVALGSMSPRVTPTLLKEGTNATGMSDRANYRITDNDELNQLWSYLDNTPGSAPSVDFSKDEVLAIFDGTHTTGGYNIQVSSITDANGTRTVHVSRIAPGANCFTTDSITSPYEIIAVPKSTLNLTHIDTSVTQNCP
jgi:hypothetical protein